MAVATLRNRLAISAIPALAVALLFVAGIAVSVLARFLLGLRPLLRVDPLLGLMFVSAALTFGLVREFLPLRGRFRVFFLSALILAAAILAAILLRWIQTGVTPRPDGTTVAVMVGLTIAAGCVGQVCFGAKGKGMPPNKSMEPTRER